MPSKSKKQSRFMRAAAHDKEFADKHNIDQDVAREFVKKDQEEKEKNDGKESDSENKS
tara:strand:+ start:421 stop:594 length:174 start_codon:yes stop_codon:yes gene_type:complete